jgi:hypothetical protein
MFQSFGSIFKYKFKEDVIRICILKVLNVGLIQNFIILGNFEGIKNLYYWGQNSLRCTKILSQCHHFLSFLSSLFYHVKSYLWIIMMEFEIVMV